VDLERYARAVAKMADEGRFDEALDVAAEALSRLPDVSTDRASWLAHSGEIEDGRGRVQDAEAAFQKALAVLDACTESRPSLRVRILTGLSKAYVKLGRIGEAEERAAEAVAIIDASPDASATALAFALRNLAAVHLLRRDFATAEQVLERVMQVLGTALAPDDPDLATALTDLAFVYDERGRAKEAAALREDAATILQTPYRRLAERLEDVMRTSGLSDAEVASLAESAARGTLGSEFLPDAKMAEAIEELAWMLFARPRSNADQSQRVHAWLLERVKTGELSMLDVVEQLALSATAS
jgi:tetratricopeptide (TPR) repeat protein